VELDLQAFLALFDSFEHTAFRLETREAYVEDEESEPLRAFLAGRPDYGWFADWPEYISGIVAAGKRFERVRVVSQPHSDYTRFGLDLARLSVAAGDDIRYLPRPEAQRLGLPNEDYWLFDSRTVVIFGFGADGRITQRLLVDEPAAVVAHSYWRDVAWHYAVHHTEYARKQGVE
jgi:hypothetical protein